MKNFIEIEVNDILISIPLSNITGVARISNESINSVLSLNSIVYNGYSNVGPMVYLSLSYEELLARIEQAQV